MTMSKLRVAVLAGGRSSEHDISRLSAISVLEALDPGRYDPAAVLIERDGSWRLTTSRKLTLAGSPKAGAHPPITPSADVAAGTGGAATLAPVKHETRPATVTNPIAAIGSADVIFPVLHGPYGEDGTIQGLLEIVGIPYVGAGVLAASVSMDKAMFKSVMRDNGIPVAPGFVVRTADGSSDSVLERAEQELGYPVFVKPARLGSSIGISKAYDRAQLRDAIGLALAHDDKILVEAFVEGVEVECGVLGNDSPEVSVPGEVQVKADSGWYDFEAKYVEGMMQLHVPASISQVATERVQAAVLAAYKAVGCCGLARIDCFVTPDDEVVVNELNTMPGFTTTSAFPKLFAASGYSYRELVSKLVDLALERHERETALRH